MTANAPDSLVATAPPEAPTLPVTPRAGVWPDAADTRWHYLGRERFLRALSFLNDFVAFLHAAVLLLVLVQVVDDVTGHEDRGPFPGSHWAGLTLSACYLALAVVLNLAVGIGLRRLRRWARWAEVILVGLFVLLVALVGVIGVMSGEGNAVAGALLPAAAGLWLFGTLVSSRTAMVVSPAYAAVIAETSYFRAGSRWPVWIAWGIYLLLLGFGFLAVVVHTILILTT